METRYRHWLTEPGEPLLHPSGLTDVARRFAAFCDSTGINPAQVISSLTVAVPLPVAPPVWDSGRRRWVGTEPTAMWHPFLWLPPRLLGRYELEGPDDTTAIESDEAWAVRVAFECTAAGVYDEESGQWLDVLSTVGLDIDDPQVVDRVRAWLDGADDAILDQLDLSEIFDDVEDPHWAVDVVATGLEPLLVIARAVTADSLLEILDDKTMPVSAVVQYASDAFDGDGQIDTGWWRDAASDPAIDQRVCEVAVQLRAVWDLYGPQLERLAVEGRELIAQAAVDPAPEPQFSWA